MPRNIKRYFSFGIGDKFVSVEAGSGYVSRSNHPLVDHVDLAIRDRAGPSASPRRIGKIHERTLAVRRAQVAAIGFSFLKVAQDMTPQTLYARTHSLHSREREPRVILLTREDRTDIDETSSEDLAKVVHDGRWAYANLQKRMHIVQRCMTLAERMSDDDAAQLDLLLTTIEALGINTVTQPDWTNPHSSVDRVEH